MPFNPDEFTGLPTTRHDAQAPIAVKYLDKQNPITGPSVHSTPRAGIQRLRGAVTAVDSTNNIVFDQTGTTIALLGVHNLIVVRTGDALLVCHRHQAERIKDLIGKLPPEVQ